MGGQLGNFAPGPSLKGAPGPGGPMKGPLNTCLKDQYTLIEQSDLNTLIEQSDLNTLIEQSQYSSEEQCSKLIDKEIWLVMGSYCHCQQVVTFFFFFFFCLHLTTWVKGPTLTLCPGPLNFSGQPCVLFISKHRHVTKADLLKTLTESLIYFIHCQFGALNIPNNYYFQRLW